MIINLCFLRSLSVFPGIGLLDEDTVVRTAHPLADTVVVQAQNQVRGWNELQLQLER